MHGQNLVTRQVSIESAQCLEEGRYFIAGQNIVVKQADLTTDNILAKQVELVTGQGGIPAKQSIVTGLQALTPSHEINSSSQSSAVIQGIPLVEHGIPTSNNRPDIRQQQNIQDLTMNGQNAVAARQQQQSMTYAVQDLTARQTVHCSGQNYTSSELNRTTITQSVAAAHRSDIPPSSNATNLSNLQSSVASPGGVAGGQNVNSPMFSNGQSLTTLPAIAANSTTNACRLSASLTSALHPSLSSLNSPAGQVLAAGQSIIITSPTSSIQGHEFPPGQYFAATPTGFSTGHPTHFTFTTHIPSHITAHLQSAGATHLPSTSTSQTVTFVQHQAAPQSAATATGPAYQRDPSSNTDATTSSS